MPLPRGYISHSQIRTYNECPRKYFFIYVQEIQRPVNDKVFLGEIFHSAIEQYFQQRINGSPIEEDAVAAIFGASFDEAAAAREITWQASPRHSRERGLAFLRYFLKHIAPAIRPLMVEKELSAELPGSGVVLKGIIDLVEEDFCLTDFKTTSSRWSPSKVRNTPQMIIYKYLFDRTFGPMKSTLKYEVLVAKDASHVRHQTFRVVPESDAVDKLLAMIHLVAEQIDEGIFPVNENPFCRYCEYKGLCREKPRA